MEFVALDVETANPDMSSICQIGVAQYDNKELKSEWKSYIDPEDYFHPVNVSIHRITEEMVKGEKTFPKVAEDLCQAVDQKIVVCHTHFDRVSLQRCFSKYALDMPHCHWLDSARVARRVWREFSYRGYGLGNICDFLGYGYQQHDALEDAKAAAFVLNSAIDKSGISITDWLSRVELPIYAEAEDVRRSGNPNGPCYGEVLVFTGSLSLSRNEAANLAAQMGCEVAQGVTKKTTILVVGDQDSSKLAGFQKSSKHRKAEELIAKGHSIRILRESDFQKIAEIILD